MRRPSQLIFLIFLVIVALGIVRVTIENSISTTGIELVRLQDKLSAYKKDNELLSEKYLENSSLLSISAKARQKGFVDSKNQVYLSAPLPLALKQ